MPSRAFDRSWESWSPEVVTAEAESFQETAALVVGLSEEELILRFGTPGEQVAGTCWMSAKGQPILQADRDVRYFALLPHTIVVFAMARGRIARVSYLPKWRRCPAEFADFLMGNHYEPA